MGGLSFEGAKESQKMRPSGERVKLEGHIHELEAALGMAFSVGPSSLIQDIGKESPLQNRVECYHVEDLMVNIMQCMWCKSRNRCTLLEKQRFRGGIVVKLTPHVEDKSDKRLLEKFMKDELFHQEEDHRDGGSAGPSKNDGYFFFDQRSPFVFSDSNEFTKALWCLPLYSDTQVQPLRIKEFEALPRFSPSMAYCPPLRRNLTIFEIQILNHIMLGERKIRRGGRRATCKDLRKKLTSPPSRDAITKAIKQKFVEKTPSGGKSTTKYRKLSELFSRAPARVESLSMACDLGPNVDFFFDWDAKTDGEGVENAIQSRGEQFLFNELKEAVIDEEIKDIPVIEARATGIIIQPDRSKLYSTPHLGVRIVREVVCEGISQPYLLVDGNFGTEPSDYFSIESKVFPSYFDLTNSPTNSEVVDILRPEIDRLWHGSTIFSAESILEVAKRGESGYLLFDDYEFRTANNFYDLIRYQQISMDSEKMRPLFDFLRRIGESTTKDIGDYFLKHIKDGEYLKEEEALEIIDKIQRFKQHPTDEIPKFSGLVKLEKRPDSKSGNTIETVTFNLFEGGTLNQVVFERSKPSSTTEFSQEYAELIDDFSLKEGEISKMERIALCRCLSGNWDNRFSESPIIGGLYLSSGVRSLLATTPRMVKIIAACLKDWAYHGTMFFSMDSEVDNYSLMMADLEFPLKPELEGSIIGWSGLRSPHEKYNKFFVETN